MKLLHVSDLHFRAPWFAWVAARAQDFDAVCVAGDLLDMFATHRAGLRAQARFVIDWVRSFPGRLSLCSGNHDWWEAADATDTDARASWIDKLASPQVTVAGQGARCGEYFIHCQAYRAPCIWPASPTSRWILLHHLPPALAATGMGGMGGNDNGCRVLADALTTAAHPPWIVLSGHLHRPKSWRGKCGPSWSLNPTCDEGAAFPNHIVIDTGTGTLTWVTERAGEWSLKVL